MALKSIKHGKRMACKSREELLQYMIWIKQWYGPVKYELKGNTITFLEDKEPLEE